MADFVAVLKKAVDALGENTPQMREKVYDKARATIETKLAAIDPPPPAAVAERQRKALADAIAVVRASYDEPAPAEEDEDLEEIFASLDSGDAARPAAPPPPAPPANDFDPSDPVEPAIPTPPHDPVLDGNGADAELAAPEPVEAGARQGYEARPGSGRRTGLVAALLLLLVLAGGGYAAWLNKDDLLALVSPPPASAPAEVAQEDGEDGEAGVTTAEELAEAAPEEEAAATQDEEEIAALPPAAEEEPAGETPAEPSAATEPEKFTQRLLADGSEVDEGPAGGPRTIGEGTSVASVGPAQQPGAPTDGEPEAADGGAEETQQPATPAMAVGQRAIFYEERTSSAQGSAEMGSIVWSVVQESPGGDLPAEPAIRAEATVPGKDVQLRMTIRRNGDQTLPASHIVEMIFLTPDGFEGGTIANVSRISFKETEQAAGNPLMGIPAKIADGFFLIALGDSPTEVETNMTLLRRQSWVDIPIVYQSGRRALLSLEKGIPGDRVFQETLRAWDEASSG